MNLARLLACFVRYVQVDTTAAPESSTYPSSAGQLTLGRMLVDELQTLGLKDAQQDEHGIVIATLPASPGHQHAPTIAFCAHLDTSPETSGTNVRPQVWRNYAGNDLVLPGDHGRVIRVVENPELKELHGRTIITSDGTTLLGADDKAGIAAIMEATAWLVEHPEIAHGSVKLCFTCDEEIGHGVDHIDLAALGATVCYTLDGSGTDTIDVETFSADLATVVVRGVNIHPSMGKGRMVNALRGAAQFIAALPQTRLSPETTDGREGFIHPYHLSGGVAEATVQLILRDFDTAALDAQAELLRAAARTVEGQIPGLKIELRITPQYRNMADGLRSEPRAVEYAQRAHERLGRKPRLEIVRGGTDGSRLTELGLPAPNLATGEHNPHSPLEWTCLEEIAQGAEVIVEVCRVWGE